LGKAYTYLRRMLITACLLGSAIALPLAMMASGTTPTPTECQSTVTELPNDPSCRVIPPTGWIVCPSRSDAPKSCSYYCIAANKGAGITIHGYVPPIPCTQNVIEPQILWLHCVELVADTIHRALAGKQYGITGSSAAYLIALNKNPDAPSFRTPWSSGKPDLDVLIEAPPPRKGSDTSITGSIHSVEKGNVATVANALEQLTGGSSEGSGDLGDPEKATVKIPSSSGTQCHPAVKEIELAEDRLYGVNLATASSRVVIKGMQVLSVDELIKSKEASGDKMEDVAALKLLKF